MMNKSKIGAIDCSKDPIITQQSAAEECDINMIVERAKRGADISHLRKAAPMYGDFTLLPSYRDALQIVVDARTQFDSLDAFVRERFHNDPAELVDFLNNPNNRDEAVKLGLVQPPPVADPPLEVKGKKLPAEEAKKPKASKADEE